MKLLNGINCMEKEQYQEIVSRMKTAAENGFEGEMARGEYLVELVDVIAVVSFEIYEKYRELIDLYKRVLKDALAAGEENLLLGYAIVKGCGMGLLLKEKYADIGIAMVERFSSDEGKGRRTEADTADKMLQAACEQVLLLKQEME